MFYYMFLFGKVALFPTDSSGYGKSNVECLEFEWKICSSKSSDWYSFLSLPLHMLLPDVSRYFHRTK